jgi:hypothetical protein
VDAKSLKNMVGPCGLEPQTSTVSTDLGLTIGLKSDTACCTQQCRWNHQAGSPNVGRQLQDTETGYGWKVAIIRKKSLAAGCQCRYNLE